MRSLLPPIAATVLLAACQQPPTNVAERPMAFPGEAWETRTPESQGIDPEGLAAALDHLRSVSGEDGIEETVIVRNGYVIFAGERAGEAHGVWSVTKSLTSTALGLLIADGRATLDLPAHTVEPLLRERYPGVTLRHFATMASGYSADGPNRWDEPSADWSRTPFRVSEPLFAPGEAFAYWDEAMIMFGRVLTRLADEDLYALLDRRIMEPIGVDEWSWWAEDSLGVHPLRFGATGIRLSALDLARVGHLFLNEGRWAGEPLLPAAWVRAATRPQVPPTRPLAATDRASIDGRGAYGYNWWVNGPGPDGRLHMPDAPPGLYYASGFNNNMCFVIPEWGMVVVRMGVDGNPPQGKPEAYNGFFARLGEAVGG